MSEADDLVLAYPTAASQLRGPVLKYLRAFAPFPTRQSLYMAVFYPRARSWQLKDKFPPPVQRANPGIVTVGDYVGKVERIGAQVIPADPDTLSALKAVSAELGIPHEWLSRLVQFESSWNPAARNPRSGARGLIQFMPKTAAALGFVAAGLFVVAGLIAFAYFFGR